jgi:hypothetical protein
MCQLGDVIQIFDSTKSNIKYKLCLREPTANIAGCFIYINSQDRYNNSLVIDATRISFLPQGKGKQTCFCFQNMTRCSKYQLKLFEARVLGRLDTALYGELYNFAEQNRSIQRKNKDIILKALRILSDI